MGIPGLTTYIENRADYYLKPFELHNTILVIDGWSLSSQLYCNVASCNHAFGGDYDQFAFCVVRFFKDLLKCGVIPLVILDGGWERKKKVTLIKRAKQRIKIAGDYGTSNRTQPFFPLLLPEVFIDVMNKLKIKYAMSTFEADDSIASISKLLNVPVLSYDSDFFIYGVDYIPFNTLDPYIVKREKGYVKRCRIYRPNTLLTRFKGMDITVLPLASILLGNDYIDRSTFSDFHNRLRIRGTKNQNEQQRRIEIVLDWLKDYSLNSAIVAILKRLPLEKRKDILRSIETIVNGYSKVSTYMIRPLGIAETTVLNMQNDSKPYKFLGSLEMFEDHDSFHNIGIEDSSSGNFSSRDQNDENSDDELDNNMAHEEWNDDVFAASVPQWFINDHLAGKFPVYFINILTHQIYLVPVQIEDYQSPSAQKISLPIITSICSLLTTTKDSGGDTTVQLLIRKGFRLHREYLTVPLSPITFENIRHSNKVQRKKIIDDTLEIRVDDKLEELPPSWQLYVAAVLFWLRNCDGIKRTKVHLDALLMSMLIGIIDRTTGSNRMNRMFGKTSSDKFVEGPREQINTKTVSNDNAAVMTDLVNAVTEEDCTAALPFFLDHIETDKKLRKMPKRFSIEIVHIYAQFQSCLRHAMHMNALLGHVYTQPSPNELFNGTLLYNLCSNFSTRIDPHTYITTKLKNSPGLLKVFMALNQKVSDASEDMMFDVGLNRVKRKRHRRRRNEVLNENDEVTIVTQCQIEESDDFCDPSNPYTLLRDA